MHCASAIGADKLLLFGKDPGVSGADGELIRQCAVGDIAQLDIQDP